MRAYTCRMCGKTTHSAGTANWCAYCGGSADYGQKKDEKEPDKQLPFIQQLKRRITRSYCTDQ